MNALKSILATESMCCCQMLFSRAYKSGQVCKHLMLCAEEMLDSRK